MAMLLEIHEDVHEGVAYGTWGCERPCVIAIAPDAPSAAEGAVHGTCGANREATNAARERARVLRFGDEVNVIVLHGVLDDAEVAAWRGREGAAARRKDASGAQACENGGGPERHVDGVSASMRWSPAMRYAGTATGPWLPTRAASASAPCARCG